jgi:ATP-dependent helicase/nuclease subunit A
MTDHTPPPDQAARDAIIGERGRNVAVVAGAGTGKTRTIIDRAVALLAPHAAGVSPIPITRMALITFTRRAAGELRFRIREHLLRELEREARANGGRAPLLREALGNLDAAFIGTIHGFADRLLRLRPVEAKLSPAYALIDDNSELVRETFLRLRRAAEAANLRAELGSFCEIIDDEGLIDEAAGTLRAAARAGLQLERAESPFGPLASLEAILGRMIDTRDVDVIRIPVPDPQLPEARAAATRLQEMTAKMRGGELGHRRLRRLTHALRRLHEVDDPAEAVRVVQDALRGRKLYKGRDFADDGFGFSIYKAVFPERPGTDSLADKLKGPHRWLATRLVRLFPVVNAMYERVKAEHEVVDYLDLLIKLRDLLRKDIEARRFYQRLFDHIFVDEFQDTDPLQCEIVFYLCENPAAARGATAQWDAVRLAPGKLTIVGDPKQSIYRFRRADIAMYGRATELLTGNGALEERLETNFRSRPELIGFFNQQLARVLGKDDGPAFDPQTGRANYEDLSPSATVPEGGVAVHVLPYTNAAGEGMLAPEGRAVEAAMVARYVRWLLDSGRTVRDPDTNAERPVRAGDVAVLACVTTNLRLLLRQLDALGIEYTARGGALFLGHPVVRQYLLGLRALADRDDGVAEAALLRPPFFALDWSDALVERFVKDDADPHRVKMTEARAVVTELRKERHNRTPGATARDLIERTALGRTVVTGHNGAQTLAGLYEVAAELERRAAIDGLDYDAATELFRSWACDPIFVEAPEPIGSTAVRVMTIHSAKGLEFPVVILWDGYQTFSDLGPSSWWQVDRGGQAWALSLGAVSVEYPAGAHLLDREKQFGEQERRRMYYVAATRARDLLVLPAPATKRKGLRSATSELAHEADGALVEYFEAFRLEQLPLWSRLTSMPAEKHVVADQALQDALDEVQQRFQHALDRAAQPIAAPAAVTLEAAGASDAEELGLESERVRKAEAGRFGALFGSVVHRALELLLSQSAAADVAAAVSLAAQEASLTDDRAAAEADVQRAMKALEQQHLFGDPAITVATEYPLAMHRSDGKLLSGYIDLLVVRDGEVLVIDYKTDAPLSGALSAVYPKYAAQLRLYGELLEAAGVIGPRRLRLGLLLTATGELRWL